MLKLSDFLENLKGVHREYKRKTGLKEILVCRRTASTWNSKNGCKT